MTADLKVKIADFGMSRDVHYSDCEFQSLTYMVIDTNRLSAYRVDYRKRGDGLVPVRWLAPEVGISSYLVASDY